MIVAGVSNATVPSAMPRYPPISRAAPLGEMLNLQSVELSHAGFIAWDKKTLNSNILDTLTDIYGPKKTPGYIRLVTARNLACSACLIAYQLARD
jgi:hypothetical protein